MEQQKQYMKYCQPLKTYNILHLIACLLMLVTALLLFFTPMFRIDLNQVPEEVLVKDTTLPKLLDFEILVNPIIDFSLFDEFRAAISARYVIAVPIGAVIIIVLGVICNIIAIVKDIMHLYSPEDYALITYDQMRDPVGIKKLQTSNYAATAYYWFIFGVFGIVFTVLIGYYRNGILGSYFAIINGVTPMVIFGALFLIATIVMFAFSSAAMRKIKLAVMRENYDKPQKETENSETIQ